MKILIGGGSGLIGTALIRALRQRGDQVTCLVRGSASDGIPWNPEKAQLADQPLEAFDAVVHLGGANIAERPWSTQRKQLLRDSRIQSTALLASHLARLALPPRLFLVASAVGLYGDRGDEDLCEDSAIGTGFLAELVRDWETAASPAREAGIRVVWARTGVVLSQRGGALAKMLLPFRLGLGGRLAKGQQFMSWIGLEDAIRALLFLIDHSESCGPYNLCAPNPVRNAEFTQALARTLNRPAFLPAPAPLLRLLLGQAADEVLLASQKAHPQALLNLGFRFLDPELQPLLKKELGVEPAH